MTAPGWYRQQYHSPACVYDADTIKDIQRTLCVAETGEMDEQTITHIRGLQHMTGVPATGIIDLTTALQIEAIRSRYGSNDNLQR